MQELWKKAARKIDNNNKFVHIVEKIQEHVASKDQADTDIDTGFNYIIKRSTFAPICFGSKQERTTLPLSGPGLSSFMARSITSEQFPALAPNIYEIKGRDWSHEVLNKKRSMKGLIGEEPRFREIFKNIAPPSSKYNIRVFPKKTKRNKVPFKQSAKRFPPPISNDSPGPGSYEISKKRKIPFIQTFGGSASLRPAIPIECVPVNLHTCEMCHLTPLIDFWHKNYTTFMCVQCYSEEFEEHSKYTTKQLREFKLMRDCSFMHDHQGTNTYITTLPAKYIKKKLLIETYLSQYFDEFIPQPVHDLPVQLVNVSKPDTINFKDTTQFYTQFKQYLMRIATRKASKRSLLIRNDNDSVDELY